MLLVLLVESYVVIALENISYNRRIANKFVTLIIALVFQLDSSSEIF